MDNQNEELVEEELDRMWEALENKEFSSSETFSNLQEIGLEPEEIRKAILDNYNEYQKQSEEIGREGLGGAVFIFIVPLLIVFNVNFTITIIVATLIGFYVNMKNPLIGILPALIFTFLFPYCHNEYYAGKVSSYRFEAIFPGLAATIPALLVKTMFRYLFSIKKRRKVRIFG